MFNEPDLGSQSNINATSRCRVFREAIRQPIGKVKYSDPSSPLNLAVCPGFQKFCLLVLVAKSILFHFSVLQSQLFFLPTFRYRVGIGDFYDYLWQAHSHFADRNSLSFQSNRFSQCYNTISGYPGMDSGLRIARVLCMSVATFELCVTKKADPELDRGKRPVRATIN